MATPTTSGQAVGTIKVVIGEVKVVAIDGTARIAQVGDKVFAKEILVTAANAVVEVQLDNGNVLDLGRDSRIALDDDVLTPGAGSVASAASAAQASQDVAALQAQIASGADPTRVGEATAAGGTPDAGGPDSGGSHEPVVVQQANSTQQVTSGFDTNPLSVTYPTLTPDLLPQTTKPVVSISVGVQVGVEQPPEGGTTTPGVGASAVNVIEGTGAPDGQDGRVVNFILQVDRAYDSDITVTYQIVPGTATTPDDFHDGPAGANTVVIPAGTTQVVVPVTIVGDALVEGDETFSIVLTDAQNATINPAANTATVTIVDDDTAPVANADTNWAQEDVVNASGNVLQSLTHGGAPSGTFADAADTDADGSVLSVTTTGTFTGTYGTLVLNADGSYTYTVDAGNTAVNALGSDGTLTESFAYTVSDGVNTPANASLTITIFGTNDAPVANADTNWVLDVAAGDDPTATGNVLQTLAHGGAPSGTFGDVADTDVDAADSLTVTTTGTFDGTYGTLVLNADGSYTYTLTAGNAAVNALDDGQTLTDSFNYTASDGTMSANASLTITIFGTDDAPVLSPATAILSEEGLAWANPDTTGNPTDSTNSVTASGNISITDVDSSTFEVTLSAPTAGLYKSGGQDIVWTLDGTNQTLTGKVGTTTIVVVTITNGGHYDVTLSGPIDHSTGGGENLLNLVFGVNVSDGTSTTSTTLTVTVEDDSPVSAVTNGIFENSTSTVLNGTLASIGADDDGSHVTLSGTAPSGLTSNGTAVVYSVSLDGSTLTATAGAGGPTVFTLHANSDGTYTFAQTGLLDLSVLTSNLQSSVGAGGPQPHYYMYTDGTFGSVVDAKDWTVDISGSSDVNPSKQGMGVGNNWLDTGESLTFNFDNEGSDGLANLVYQTRITVNDFGAGESIDWTANIVGGGTLEGTVYSADLVDGQIVISAPIGQYLDNVIFTAGEDTAVRLTGVSTYVVDDTATKTLAFNYTATDGDGDSVNGTFSLTAQNGATLTGDDTDNALAGGSDANTLFGNGGNDIIIAGDGNDIINGGDGNDIINGGSGNDILTGGGGNDTFTWLAGDQGTGSAPAIDTITDFDNGTNVLNLADLLQGESHVGTDPGNLSSYLHFVYDADTNSTTIEVKSLGGATAVDQQIVLTGVDLTAGNTMAGSEIITNLLSQAKLVTE